MRAVIFSLFLFSLLASPLYAQEVPATEERKETAQIAVVFDEMFLYFESLRLRGAEYFIKTRDAARTRLKIGIPPKSPSMDLGVAAERPEKEFKQDGVELDNPLDYPIYIGASSLATLFSNKTLFYVTIILLTLIIIRSIIVRIKYS